MEKKCCQLIALKWQAHIVHFQQNVYSIERKKVKSLSHARLFATPWIVACPKLLRPWDFQGKSTEVGCYFFLQGIFPTQGSNPGLSHYRQMLYHLSHHVSPLATKRVTKTRTYLMKSFLIFCFQQSWPWAFTSIKCYWYLSSTECHSKIIELRNIRRSGFLFEKYCTFFKDSTWVNCGLRQLQNVHLYLTVWSMTFHLDQMTLFLH